MANAAVYLRAATGTQALDDVLLTAQRAACLAYIKDLGDGWHLLPDPTSLDLCFTDIGRPHARQPAYSRLLACARSRKMEMVVVWRLDRLDADPYGTLPNISALVVTGVRLVSVQEGDTTEILGLLSLIQRAGGAVARAGLGPGVFSS